MNIEDTHELLLKDYRYLKREYERVLKVASTFIETTEALVGDLYEHEGAEGFSVGTEELYRNYHKALIALKYEM